MFKYFPEKNEKAFNAGTFNFGFCIADVFLEENCFLFFVFGLVFEICAGKVK